MTKLWVAGTIFFIVMAITATAYGTSATSTTVTVPMDIPTIGGSGGGGVTQCLVGNSSENLTAVDCAQLEKIREVALQEEEQNRLETIKQQALDIHQMSTTIAYMGLIIPFGIILVIAFLMLIYVRMRTRWG